MKYLLLDRRFLNPQGMENVVQKTAKLEKDRKNGVLFTEEKPWEVRIDNGYPNVIYDKREGIYRCYYTLFIADPDSRGVPRRERAKRNYEPGSSRAPGLAYAESQDGVHWRKPVLSLVEWEGSLENNLLFPYAHGTGVMLDSHESDETKRYKLVTKVDQPGKRSYMAVSFSADGIHWQELIPWPRHNPPADSHNLPFWDEREGCYQLISRIWKDGIRITTRSRSHDFIHWSEPEEVLRGDGFSRQVYAMPVFQWENLTLGLASVIHEGDRMAENFDLVDCELAWEADGGRFDWVAPGQSLIERGRGSYPDGEPDCGCIYASPPVIEPDGNLLVYYMGGNGRHTNYRETSLLRGRLRKDRFAAYEQKRTESDGILSSCRIRITGGELRILADLTDHGGPVCLQVQVGTEWNKGPLSGFSFEDSHADPSEDGWYRITFEGRLETLSGQLCCVQIRFSNLKLWAVEGDVRLERHRLWEGASEEELEKESV